MKICLYTDNHYTSYSSIVRSRGKQYSSRLENQIKTLNWVQRTAEQYNCTEIICLGDFFDKNNLNAEEISALKEIEWSKIPNKFLVGNHEMGSSDLFLNSTNVLTNIGEVIDKPKLEEGFGYSILYLPYILEEYRKPISEYYKEFYKDTFSTQEVKNQIILSHNDIAGINYGGYTSKHGFKIDDIENNCNLYINGHLHNQTWVTDKILNLGNITGQNFSEDAFKYNHTLAILDTETLKVELIENPYAYNFYKIELEEIKELEEISKEIKGQAVATIKAPEALSKEVRAIANEIFNEYRLLLTRAHQDTQGNISESFKIDHVKQFGNYITEVMGISDLIIEELSLLGVEI